VQLVGGAGWHHPSLPIRGGAAVQGALIVDDFAGELGGDAAAQFAAAFQQRTGRAPSAAAAQVYDAATLVASARAAIGPTGERRAALRAALARAKLDDGACGPAAIGADGEIDRTPSVLEVRGDELVLAR
jgi:ABC-type branched-subunit amino acid transport system substrate-binding protein